MDDDGITVGVRALFDQHQFGNITEEIELMLIEW